MWWEQSPSLSSSRRSGGDPQGEDTVTTITLRDSPENNISKDNNMPNSEEFRKLPTERQTEELFILMQRLLPLVGRVDSLTETVTSMAERMNSIEAAGHHKNHSMEHDETTAHDSDSLYKSLTSLGASGADNSSNKPDPFIIKRSREINR
jgi:hypothetical protein